MTGLKVHHVQFFKYKPQAVHNIAYDSISKRLALSRADGSVEIFSQNWYQESVITLSEGHSVEGLIWLDGRLFSVGLSGNVVEYDLASLQIKREESANAKSLWCVSKNEKLQQLAVGSEDGCVVLFDVAYNKLEYLRSFHRLEGHIMCIAWHTEESMIVTGGMDFIRIWSVTSGQALQRITMGGKNTMVWCLAVTSDMTIISGDSRGKLSFWNGRQGTRIAHFQSHKADVLTLCLDETETSVYCSGVSPEIVQYSYLSPSADSGWRSWVRSKVLNYHTHDVRASVVVGNTVITGGVDTNLTSSIVSGKQYGRFLRVPAVPSLSMVTVAKEAGLLLLRYPTYLEVWRLGNTDATSGINGQILPLKSQQLKLAELKARPGKRIACSTISQDGSVIAFSDGDKVRLKSFSVTDLDSLSPTVKVSRLAMRVSDTCPAQRFAVTPDNKHLVVASNAGCLQVWKLTTEKAVLQHSLQLYSSERRHAFSNLCVSDNSKLVVVTDTGGHVCVVTLGKGEVMCRLPVLPQQATAVNFSPASKTLLVAYSDLTVREFDVEKAEYTAWSRSYQWPDQWFRQHGLLRGIMCQPSHPSTFFLHSEHNLMMVDTAQPSPEKDYKLFKGKPATDSDKPRPLIACDKYKFILHMEFLTADSLVMVERTPNAIKDELPAAFAQKKFGT